MIKQLLALCLIALVSAQSKFYAVDNNMQIKEISAGIADFVRNDPTINAYVEFKDDRNASGWVYYYYKAGNVNPDWLQIYLSGYMEGYSAYYLIYDSWVNMQGSIGNLNQDVKNFLDQQLSWVTEMVESNPTNSYWNAVNMTLTQIHGVYDGFQVGIQAANRLDMNITFDQFYLITYLTDLGDIVAKFTGENIKYPRCSFLAKIVGDNLFVSHTTWSGYTALLRSYKVLDFSLQNPMFKTQRISYSGLPGSIVSQDDFYIVDDARVVTETSLLSDNNAVYEYIHTNSVPYWIRITAANWLFDTQQNWMDIFFAYRSGTYNNQWLLIDFNNWNASVSDLSQAKNVIWMVEEFYQLTSYQDVTQELLVPQGYVASYNVPFTAAIQNLSMNPTNYTTDPRAILFKKYAPGIQSLDDFKFVMRLNNVSDTGDYCQAISSRCDLNPNTSFPWGAIDCKVTSDYLAPTQQAWVIAGPTHQDVTPFSWVDWPQYTSSRNGMPDVYDFDWVYVNPNSNYSATAPEHGKLPIDGGYAFIMESSWRQQEGQDIFAI